MGISFQGAEETKTQDFEVMQALCFRGWGGCVYKRVFQYSGVYAYRKCVVKNEDMLYRTGYEIYF